MMHSDPYPSADRRAMYVTMSSGQRRRVAFRRGEEGNQELVFVRRVGKAAKRAWKRARHKGGDRLVKT